MMNVAEKKLTIIHIDDDPRMIDLVKEILNRPGYIVLGAEGGVTGLELIKHQSPDLVLLDLMMPDLEGWRVFQQIRNLPHTKKTPIIILTGKSSDTERTLGLHLAGANGYICKPFLPQDLLDCIQRLLH